MARVLLVDDDEMLLDVLKVLLVANGYEVVLAFNGNEALDVIRTVELDCVITDIRMTPMNGMELLRMIRQERPNLPVIMLTAYASARTAKESKGLGAVGYLSKPFTNEEVVGIVREAIESRGRGATSQQAGQPAS